jgi:hypothetical protein
MALSLGIEATVVSGPGISSLLLNAIKAVEIGEVTTEANSELGLSLSRGHARPIWYSGEPSGGRLLSSARAADSSN